MRSRWPLFIFLFEELDKIKCLQCVYRICCSILFCLILTNKFLHLSVILEDVKKKEIPANIPVMVNYEEINQDHFEFEHWASYLAGYLIMNLNSLHVRENILCIPAIWIGSFTFWKILKMLSTLLKFLHSLSDKIL